MKWAALTLVLLFAGAVHAQRPVEFSPSRVLDGLLSPDAGLRDRANMELRNIDAESAERVGVELLRYGVRDSQLVLAAIPALQSANACIVAVYALDSKEFEVRACALDVVTSAKPEHAAHAEKHALNARRAEALRRLIEDIRYTRRLCEGLHETRPPVEEAMRLMIVVDRQLGARGLSVMLRHCAELMLGEEALEDGANGHALKHAEQLRRAAALLLEAICIFAPATQLDYHAAHGYEHRERAVQRLRRMAEELEARELELGGARFRGARYGDYLQDLFSHDVMETRVAAYLRLKWWRGEEVVISGEGYAEAVDHFNALGRRELAAQRREIRQWWEAYRKQTES
jgi:hypothetical protein